MVTCYLVSTGCAGPGCMSSVVHGTTLKHPFPSLCTVLADSAGSLADSMGPELVDARLSRQES